MKRYIYFSLLYIWSFSINAMQEIGEDLKRSVHGAMIMSGKLSLYEDNGFKNKALKELCKEEKKIEELGKYYAQRTIDMMQESFQSIPSEEAFRLKYPEDYRRIGKLRRASVYDTWANSVEEKKEYSMLLSKQHQFFKEYLIDKKKQGLLLNDYEERNLQSIIAREKYKEIK